MLAKRRFCILGVVAGLGAATMLLAQDAPITTLHVYTNLIQIPVLVLGPRRRTPVAHVSFQQIQGEHRWRATVPADACAAGGR